MDNTGMILKNAFIDAQLVGYSLKQHEFSEKFETKMQRTIKYQKGVWRLINTKGKKAACIILSLLIFTASTVFSVKALREPVIEAIQHFFVNIREQLTGTKANNIAEHFSEDITQIVATNLITTEPKEYIIDDQEKISDFVELMRTTNWITPKNEFDAGTDYITYRFEFKSGDKTVTTLNMCSRFPGLFGIAEIIYDGKSTVYNISERAFLDILAFTTQKYYLHKSDLEQPDSKQCYKWQEKALKGLNESEKKEFCEAFKYLHLHIESFLLGNVSTLKEPDSVYWESYELKRDEPFIDPITGTALINNTYHIMSDLINKLLSLAEDQQMKDILTTVKADYINAFKYHNIGSLFALHEVIHDYDYYVVNYPISYSLAPPDWGGLDDYFGHLEMKE